MQIVANSRILKEFSKIDIFNIDLGKNLRGSVPKTGKYDDNFNFKITDTFVKKYDKTNGKIVYKFGTIGTLKFYVEYSLADNEIEIHKSEDEIFEMNINFNKLQENPKKYLTNLLYFVENGEQPEDDIIENVSIIKENDDTIPEPSIDLPKDIFIEKMIERRRKLSPNVFSEEEQKSIENKRKKNLEKYGY